MDRVTMVESGHHRFCDWLRFQEYAKSNGFDSLRFVGFFPSGPRDCKWLDAYFGLIEVEGMEGFVTVGQLDEIAPDALCVVQP
jgi:hypothetical protein